MSMTTTKTTTLCPEIVSLDIYGVLVTVSTGNWVLVLLKLFLQFLVLYIGRE